MSPTPKPTSIRLLEGRSPGRDSGGRPVSLQDEPHPEPGEPKPPKWLTAAALAIWEETLEALRPTGIITLADRYQLAAYCMLVDELGRKGDTFSPVKLTQLRSYSGLFGLSPADRARFGIRKAKSDRTEDPMDRLRKRERKSR